MPGPRRRPIPTPPAGGRPKVAGLHRRASDVTVEEVLDNTGFPLAVDDAVPVTRGPTAHESYILQDIG